MSDILGYDIDGQPLRAGDRVVYVGDGTRKDITNLIGNVLTLTGETKNCPISDEIGVEGIEDKGWFYVCSVVRKIKRDDRGKDQYKKQFAPSSMSLDQIIKQANSIGERA